ncbi:MAG TPA: lipopolysaccharide assembly protein LapA domain-containing protein [Candidatus Dormibacteraeota bacterium]|nr:lipopolysaccharide assembly protein LapA domain-containing protein [Candidatus Dormibacteraeota bacterium]
MNVSMAIVGWVAALLLGIVLALFSVGNQQAATINVLGTTFNDIPTWVVMLASAAIGALMVIVISMVDRLRWFMSSRYTKKVLNEHKKMLVQRDNRIAELEQEMLRLRGAA